MSTHDTIIIATRALADLLREREHDFIQELNALGNPQLSLSFADIVNFRRTHERLVNSLKGDGTTKVSDLTVKQEPIVLKPKSVSPGRGASTLPELGFSLRDAVRELLPTFGPKYFTTRQMFEALQAKHGPNVIGEERLASVSATLANMYNRKELDKTIGPQRKVKFTAAKGGLNFEN